MIINKDRFDSEHQWEIAKESIDKAYQEKYGEVEDITEYEEIIDRVLLESDESAFRGTDEEIKKMWYNPDIFE